MTTQEPEALADAIDPRAGNLPDAGFGIYLVAQEHLIAASDFIRAQASPPADVMEVVKRLRALADSLRGQPVTARIVDDDQQLCGFIGEPNSVRLSHLLSVPAALTEAASLLLSLSTSLQEAQDRAFEKAATAAEAATLPDGFQWGREAMESFNFGKKRASLAIRNLKGKSA
jgi:hypothetical protein